MGPSEYENILTLCGALHCVSCVPKIGDADKNCKFGLVLPLEPPLISQIGSKFKMQLINCRFRVCTSWILWGTEAAALLPFRPGEPALCGICPL